MGLDMWINKKTYVGAMYKHRGIEGRISLKFVNEKGRIPIKFRRVSEIIEEVAYWRKNWTLHNYIIATFFSDEKEITINDIKEILALCKEAKEGDYNDLSEMGVYELDLTIQQLTDIVEEYDKAPNQNDIYYEYISSW